MRTPTLSPESEREFDEQFSRQDLNLKTMKG